jgi:2-polyprenyl-6-methoxyphenol hydroxylase-like FAD-dependent oxidoreductase
MNQEQDAVTDRQAAAEIISARAMEIGRARGIAITQCVWDIGQDLGHPHAHRLDIFTEAKSVRLYFPDIELTSMENEVRRKRTETRLNNAIAQLLSRVPSATYSYR